MQFNHASPTANQRTFIHSSITALAFYSAPAHGLQNLLLSAQDTHLKIYSTTATPSTAPPLVSLQIFPAQPIQGFAICPTTHAVLIWGGPWLAIVHAARIAHALSLPLSPTAPPSEVVAEAKATTILRSPDWIYHGAFLSPSTIVVVTAHNEVLPLRRRDGGGWRWGRVHAPPSSRPILYAARLECVGPDGDVLVAAGTAFGEIVVWRCRVSESDGVGHGKGEGDVEVEVLYVLTGHEGSIFGVDISPEVCVAGKRTRLLASCSDDRTIRVWDVSGCLAPWHRNDDADDDGRKAETARAFPEAKETGFGGNPVADLEAQAGCVSAEPVAVAIGHVSRIWNVRFARASSNNNNNNNNGATEKMTVYSFGEDATAQRWRLDLHGQDLGDAGLTARLTHEAIIHRHTGKHIWSSAVLEAATPGEKTLVATGGSDGKINVAEEEETPPDADARSVMLDVSGAEIVRRFPDADAAPQHADALSATTKRKRGSAEGEPFLVYTIVLDGPILATTSSGRLFSGRLDGAAMAWSEVPLPRETQQDLRQYQILRSAGKGVALLGSTSGRVYVYVDGVVSHLCTLPGKISDIFTLGPSDLCALRLWDSNASTCVPILVSIMGSPLVTLLILDRTGTGFTVLEEHAMELDAGFLPTAVGTCDGHLVFGSRIGALLVYDPTYKGTSKVLERRARVERPLTKDAVSCIIPLPPRTPGVRAPYFLTTSRDGHYRVYEITATASSPHMHITLRHQSLPPLGPHLESALFAPGATPNGPHELVLTGFRSKNFVAWNETRQHELATVECGGAFRAFTHRLDPRDPARLAFVCTRAGRTCVYAQKGLSQRAVKRGGHGREIKAVAASVGGLVATGAEDTTIRIWGYTPSCAPAAAPSNVAAAAGGRGGGGGDDDGGGLRCLAVIEKHATGIQCLRWAGPSYLLSSSGAEELCIWRVTRLAKSNYDGLAIVCEGMYPDRTRDGDLRIMGFDVEVLPPPEPHGQPGQGQGQGQVEEEVLCLSLVLSNSTLKTYRYSRTAGFTLLAHGRYTGACLLQIRHLRVASNSRHRGPPMHLLTAATDGRLALWTSSPPSALHTDSEQDRARVGSSDVVSAVAAAAATYALAQVVALHQSSIKSLDLRPLRPGRSPSPSPSYVVVTGGDDNALGYAVLAWDAATGHFLVAERGRADGAHAAAVTGLCIAGVAEVVQAGRYGVQVCTASTDQRVKSWRVVVGGGGKARVKLVRDAYSGVADAADLELLGDGEEAVLVGVGMEVWRL